MGILKNTTDGIHPRIVGFKPGETATYLSARRTGKSYYAMMASMEINNIKFMLLTSALVDNEPWYSLLVNKEAAAWLRTQDKSVSIELHDRTSILDHSIFDVHETIYTMMVLKFS